MLPNNQLSEELLNSTEAARVLGVGVRMFNKIISSSGPRPYKTVGQERLYRAKDILILKELRDEEDIGLHSLIIDARRSIIESRAMREELDSIKYALRINIPALSLDQEDVMAAVFKIEDDLANDRDLSREELLEWAHFLHGVHEPYLRAISMYFSTKEPWRGILNLARKLCANQPTEITRADKELENIYGLLNSGLRIARQAAYFYVREQNGKMFAEKMFPEAKNSPHEDVLALSFAI
jgi:hypothetical protein